MLIQIILFKIIMKKFKLVFPVIIAFALLLGVSCKKDEKKMKFGSAKIGVSFGLIDKNLLNTYTMTKQTPENYIIALKSCKLMGDDGTADFELFNETSLTNSQIFDFTAGTVTHNLTDEEIPEGNYTSFKFELYYLQMTLPISTVNRGTEYRKIRIYFSNDGTHRPGDVTQIDNSGIENGWLFGENQMPDFDPVTPRTAAYTHAGNGTDWYQFADKNGQNYGPFGQMSFWSNATNPFTSSINFTFEESDGQNVVINFNVFQCWQFEDKNSDGNFGGQDLMNDPDPTRWNMNYPIITVSLQ